MHEEPNHRTQVHEPQEPSDLLLRVQRIGKDISELEEWAMMVGTQLMQAWERIFPPMTCPQSREDQRLTDQAYTTAAIYIVRLRECAKSLKTIEQIPRGLRERLGGQSYASGREFSDQINAFLDEKIYLLVTEAKKSGLAEELTRLLGESNRVHEGYATGYVAQAPLCSDATRVSLWFRLMELVGISDRSPDQRSKSLFVPRATHANAFLFYLVINGILRMTERGIPQHETTWSTQLDVVIQKVEERAHYLLAKGLMEDSAEFDPGELAHAVATLRLLQKKGDEWWRRGARMSFFQQCFDFVFKAQAKDGLWNAGRPWIYSAEGGALHMISLERANAALEVLSDPVCFDSGFSESGLFERYEQNFRRVHQWLRQTLQHLRHDGTDVEVWGWTSEHSFEFGGKIHLWVNAHALRFCVLYREALRLLLERLILSKFPLVKRPSEFDKREPIDPLRGTGNEVWSRIESGLPKTGIPNNPNTNYSYLLYGPPGTSKTTLARRTAEVLNVPFVTITCSDFISQGADAVEAQANLIFKLLEELPRGVILFDEIDPFIHDREDRSSHTESFQFMTTSMLPKLQDLRDRKRVVFFIASNNAERIDLAIQRSGRVDLKLLVPPPNKEARREMVRQILKDKSEELREDIARAIAEGAPWYTFSELKDIAQRIAAGRSLEQCKKAMTPAASFAVYCARHKAAKLHGRHKDVALEFTQVMRALELRREDLPGDSFYREEAEALADCLE